MARISHKLLIPLFALVCAICLFNINFSSVRHPVIRADGVGYYAYLPSLVLFGDPGFEHYAALLKEGHYTTSTEIPVFTGIARYSETGRYLDKYSIGEAVLLVPFFLIATISAFVLGFPINGFSAPFQFWACLGGCVYLIGGLLLLRRLLSRYYAAGTVSLTLLSIFFGTNLLYYGTFDNTFSHVYSFFAFALFLNITEAWFARPSRKVAALVGVAAALVVLIRPPNAIFLITFLMFDVQRVRDFRTHGLKFWQSRKQLLLAASAALPLILLQLSIWHYATGHWLVDSYFNERFCFDSPQLTGTLFSPERGALFWSPILSFSLLGLFCLRRYSPQFSTSTYLILPAHLYITASWCAWWYGDGLGHRVFIDELPLLALPMAAFYQTIFYEQRVKLLRVVIGLCVGLFIALSVRETVLYWQRAIPGEKVTWNDYTRIVLGLPHPTLSIVVDPVCRKQLASFPAGRDCKITATAKDSSGKVAANVTVIVELLDRQHRVLERVATDNSDAKGEGHFSLQFVRSGHYRFSAEIGNRVVRSKLIRVRVKQP